MEIKGLCKKLTNTKEMLDNEASKNRQLMDKMKPELDQSIFEISGAENTAEIAETEVI